jgi:hypothetical protein
MGLADYRKQRRAQQLLSAELTIRKVQEGVEIGSSADVSDDTTGQAPVKLSAATSAQNATIVK